MNNMLDKEYSDWIKNAYQFNEDKEFVLMSRDKDGKNFFHYAVENEDLVAVRTLIEHNANPFVSDVNNFNALNYAVISKNIEILALFLQNYSNAYILNDIAFCITIALEDKSNDILNQLLETRQYSNLSYRETPLIFWAVQFGNIMGLRMLIETGADPLLLDTSDEIHVSLIYSASSYGNFEIVKYLIEEQQLQINDVTANHCTPIYIAYLYGHDSVVEYLLGEGADINIADNDNNYLLLSAVKNDDFNSFKLFIDAGANVLVQDNLGNSVSTYINELSKNSREKFTQYIKISN